MQLAFQYILYVLLLFCTCSVRLNAQLHNVLAGPYTTVRDNLKGVPFGWPSLDNQGRSE